MSERLPPDRRDYWTGKVTICDLCKVQIDRFFVDARTKEGRWGIFCSPCYKNHGIGLGPGKGQKYQLEIPSDPRRYHRIEG